VNLFLVSDLHLSTSAAHALVERAPKADVVVIAGDLAQQRRGLRDYIALLDTITTPTVLVAGNAESPDELREACAHWPAAHVLHGDDCEIDGITFFGIGGAIPITPFGSWSFDLTEDGAHRLASPCPDSCVLVSHSPPKGLLDRSSSGESLGSTTIRELVDTRSPRLVVCGHIHDSAGQSVTAPNGVPVVNAGPRGMAFDLSATSR
jgi:Icc-related predicted phosphoesterase